MASTHDIARELLRIQAVFLRPDEPFTWASGIRSPIYCDNRLTLSYPAVRTLVDESIAGMVQKLYPDAQALMGTSTAGIAHAAIAADRLGLPMGYVRGSAKDHGRKNQIEGRRARGSLSSRISSRLVVAYSTAWSRFVRLAPTCLGS